MDVRKETIYEEAEDDDDSSEDESNNEDEDDESASEDSEEASESSATSGTSGTSVVPNPAAADRPAPPCAANVRACETFETPSRPGTSIASQTTAEHNKEDEDDDETGSSSSSSASSTPGTSTTTIIKVRQTPTFLMSGTSRISTISLTNLSVDPQSQILAASTSKSSLNTGIYMNPPETPVDSSRETTLTTQGESSSSNDTGSLKCPVKIHASEPQKVDVPISRSSALTTMCRNLLRRPATEPRAPSAVEAKAKSAVEAEMYRYALEGVAEQRGKGVTVPKSRQAGHSGMSRTSRKSSLEESSKADARVLPVTPLQSTELYRNPGVCHDLSKSRGKNKTRKESESSMRPDTSYIDNICRSLRETKAATSVTSSSSIIISSVGGEIENIKSLVSVMRYLERCESTDDKLRVMSEKYAAMIAEQERLQVSATESEKRIYALRAEKEDLFAKHDRCTKVRDRLKVVCKSLQQQIRELKLESMAREEEGESSAGTAEMEEERRLEVEGLRGEKEVLATRLDWAIDEVEKQKEITEMMREEVHSSEMLARKAKLENDVAMTKLTKYKHEVMVHMLAAQGRHETAMSEVKKKRELLEEKDLALVESQNEEVFQRCAAERYKEALAKAEEDAEAWNKLWKKSHKTLLETNKRRREQKTELVEAERKITVLKVLCRRLEEEQKMLRKTVKGLKAGHKDSSQFGVGAGKSQPGNSLGKVTTAPDSLCQMVDKPRTGDSLGKVTTDQDSLCRLVASYGDMFANMAAARSDDTLQQGGNLAESFESLMTTLMNNGLMCGKGPRRGWGTSVDAFVVVHVSQVDIEPSRAAKPDSIKSIENMAFVVNENYEIVGDCSDGVEKNATARADMLKKMTYCLVNDFDIPPRRSVRFNSKVRFRRVTSKTEDTVERLRNSRCSIEPNQGFKDAKSAEERSFTKILRKIKVEKDDINKGDVKKYLRLLSEIPSECLTHIISSEASTAVVEERPLTSDIKNNKDGTVVNGKRISQLREQPGTSTYRGPHTRGEETSILDSLVESQPSSRQDVDSSSPTLAEATKTEECNVVKIVEEPETNLDCEFGVKYHELSDVLESEEILSHEFVEEAEESRVAEHSPFPTSISGVMAKRASAPSVSEAKECSPLVLSLREGPVSQSPTPSKLTRPSELAVPRRTTSHTPNTDTLQQRYAQSLAKRSASFEQSNKMQQLSGTPSTEKPTTPTIQQAFERFPPAALFRKARTPSKSPGRKDVPVRSSWSTQKPSGNTAINRKTKTDNNRNETCSAMGESSCLKEIGFLTASDQQIDYALSKVSETEGAGEFLCHIKYHSREEKAKLHRDGESGSSVYNETPTDEQNDEEPRYEDFSVDDVPRIDNVTKNLDETFAPDSHLEIDRETFRNHSDSSAAQILFSSLEPNSFGSNSCPVANDKREVSPTRMPLSHDAPGWCSKKKLPGDLCSEQVAVESRPKKCYPGSVRKCSSLRSPSPPVIASGNKMQSKNTVSVSNFEWLTLEGYLPPPPPAPVVDNNAVTGTENKELFLVNRLAVDGEWVGEVERETAVVGRVQWLTHGRSEFSEETSSVGDSGGYSYDDSATNDAADDDRYYNVGKAPCTGGWAADWRRDAADAGTPTSTVIEEDVMRELCSLQDTASGNVEAELELPGAQEEVEGDAFTDCDDKALFQDGRRTEVVVTADMCGDVCVTTQYPDYDSHVKLPLDLSKPSKKEKPRRNKLSSFMRRFF